MLRYQSRLKLHLVLASGAALLAFQLGGCDMGLQAELDKKKAERFAEAAAALKEIGDSRLTKPGGIVASFPTKLDPDVRKRGKQIVDWRMGLAVARHVDPAADPKAREAAGKLRELALKRFATPEEAAAEVEKLTAQYNVSADFARSLRDAAIGSSGRQFEEEIVKAIERYSPVRTYDVALSKLAEKYKGTPTEQAAIDAAAFAKASHAFWTHAKEKNYGRMRGTASKYIKFLKGWLKSMGETVAAAKKAGDKDFVPRLFLNEAAFDLVFLHGASIWRGTNPVPFWAIRFNVPSGSKRTLNEYVTKLCRESDQRKRCLPVPHERRADALRIPYLSWVQEKARAFSAAHPGSEATIFRNVMTLLDKDLTAAVKATPDLSEDPKMPAMYTTRAPSSGFNLLMSKKQGIKLTGLKVVPVEWPAFTGKLPADFKTKMTAKIAEVANPETKAMVDPSTVTVLAEGDMPGSEFKKLVESLSYEIVNKFDFVGRRRADESMKAAGVLLRRPAADSAKNLTYNLGADEKSKVTCGFAGYGGDMSNRKVATKFVLFGKDGKFKAGDIERYTEETAGDKKDLVGRIKGVKVNVDIPVTDEAGIQKHANTLSGGVRVFLPTTWTYDKLMSTLTGLTTKCADLKLKVGPRMDKELIIPCGEAAQRPFRFDLGLCN